MASRRNTQTSRRSLLSMMAMVAGIGLPLALHAQPANWPSKPVVLVVGVPAGGAIDAYARALAQHLGELTGGTFIVENKAGANGNISAEYVLKAPADGYMLWISTAGMMTVNPSAYSNLRWKQSDFKPITKGVEAPLVLVTHPSVPARTLAELVQWVKSNPGKVSYASFSPGTPSQFLGFQLNERFKLDMTHVPYKGSAPQVQDLLGGQVPLGFSQLQTTLPHIAAGKLNAIAVTSEKRSRYLPQVPTLAELGLNDLSSTIWFGLFAPASTPAAILEKLEAASVKVQSDPRYRARLEEQGFDVSTEHGDAFARSIAAETTRWAEVVRATGFKANN